MLNLKEGKEYSHRYWWINDESLAVLNRGYLLNGETVEGAVDRITTAAAKRLNNMELQPIFKEMVERGWMSLSSPIWANMGTQRGLPISCVTGDTLIEVKTDKGIITLPIEELTKKWEEGVRGYEIKVFNTDTKEIEYAKINKVWETKKTQSFIHISVGAANTYNLRCTPDHLILKADGEYVPAGDLKTFDKLQGESYKTVVDVVSVWADEEIPVFDIEVDHPSHNFYLPEPQIFVHNCFGASIPDNIEGITHKVGEVIMQTKIGGGTSGYFGELRGRGAAITDNGKSSGAVSFMKMFDTTMDVVSQGSCYEKGTEVLTDKGFKDFREVNPKLDKIAQVDEYGNIDFTDVFELTSKKYIGDLVKIRGLKKDDLISVAVTTNHRMVIERMKGSKGAGTRRWAGYTEIVTAEDLKLHRDNRLYISGKTITNSNRLSDVERLKIAFQADGRKDNRSNTIRFRFTKQRKVERLLEIVKRIGLKYELKIESNSGVTNIYIYDAKELKQPTLSWVELDKVSYEWCQDFLEEVSKWDGHEYKHCFYSSINKENVDIIQAVASLCNKRTRIYTKTDRPGNRSDLYTITISDNNKVQGDSCEIYREHYDDMVYCCIVPKGRILVRSNDRTLVCGNTRRGSFAAYLDIDHPDVEEFLQIKDIGNPIQNLFFSVCVPDYWMQEMIDGDMEKRKLWARILESRQQKGLPYVFFTDNNNKNKSQIYKDLDLKITHSNLCCEISLPDSTDESFVCCLSSMNLELYDEWKDTNAVYYAIYFLDAVMSEFIEKTEDNYYLKNSHNFAKRHRALGLGVLGYHSYFQKHNISFNAPETKVITQEIFGYLRREALRATKALSKIYGPAPIYNEIENYPEHKKQRNTTVMAIAPTTSSSSILGQVSPGIEPYSSNYYKVGLAKGNFIRKNKYLTALLESKGKNTEEVWRQIMLAQGSVQGLDFLTPQEKEVFKTFRELSQRHILVLAQLRQKYIDQGQSLNINIPAEVPVKEVNAMMIDAWKWGIKGLYYQRSSSVAKELLTNIITCSSCES